MSTPICFYDQHRWRRLYIVCEWDSLFVSFSVHGFYLCVGVLPTLILWRVIGLYNHFVSIASLPPQGAFKQQKLLLHDKAILWVLPVYTIVFHTK